MELGEQPGLQRRAGIGIEAQPDALHHRAAELAGRGYDLGCRLGTDPGYLLEPGYAGGPGLADGTVPGGLDGPEPEPALRGLLEPRQGKLGQLPVHDVVARRLVRGPGRAAPGRWCGGYVGKAGPEVPGLGDEGAGSRVILILRRMPGFDDFPDVTRAPHPGRNTTSREG